MQPMKKFQSFYRALLQKPRHFGVAAIGLVAPAIGIGAQVAGATNYEPHPTTTTVPEDCEPGSVGTEMDPCETTTTTEAPTTTTTHPTTTTTTTIPEEQDCYTKFSGTNAEGVTGDFTVQEYYDSLFKVDPDNAFWKTRYWLVMEHGFTEQTANDFLTCCDLYPPEIHPTTTTTTVPATTTTTTTAPTTTTTTAPASTTTTAAPTTTAPPTTATPTTAAPAAPAVPVTVAPTAPVTPEPRRELARTGGTILGMMPLGGVEVPVMIGTGAALVAGTRKRRQDGSQELPETDVVGGPDPDSIDDFPPFTETQVEQADVASEVESFLGAVAPVSENSTPEAERIDVPMRDSSGSAAPQPSPVVPETPAPNVTEEMKAEIAALREELAAVSAKLTASEPKVETPEQPKLEIVTFGVRNKLEGREMFQRAPLDPAMEGHQGPMALLPKSLRSMDPLAGRSLPPAHLYR